MIYLLIAEFSTLKVWLKIDKILKSSIWKISLLCGNKNFAEFLKDIYAEENVGHYMEVLILAQSFINMDRMEQTWGNMRYAEINPKKKI